MSQPVRRTLRVACSIEHAFDTFVHRIDAWWPVGHRRFERSVLTLEPRAGGRFVERADDGDEALRGDVVACEPPHRVSWTWYPGAISEPTLVEVTFRAEGAHTVVDVVHAEGDAAMGEAWPGRAARFATSWDHVLDAWLDAFDLSAEFITREQPC